jgi:hypothetical protein
LWRTVGKKCIHVFAYRSQHDKNHHGFIFKVRLFPKEREEKRQEKLSWKAIGNNSKNSPTMIEADHTSLFIVEDDSLVFKGKYEPLRSLFVIFFYCCLIRLADIFLIVFVMSKWKFRCVFIIFLSISFFYFPLFSLLPI